MSRNPLENLDLVANPDTNFVMIMKGGKAVFSLRSPKHPGTAVEADQVPHFVPRRHVVVDELLVPVVASQATRTKKGP